MPNWCENSVQIIGKAEDVAGFVRGLKGKRQKFENTYYIDDQGSYFDEEVYTFSSYVPVPEEVIKIGFSGKYRDRRFREILDEFEVPYKKESTSRYLMSNLQIDREELGKIIISQNKKVPGFDDLYSELVEKMNNYIKDEKKSQEAQDLLKSILFVDDGYHWQVKNWGTKWDPDLIVDEDDIDIMEKNNAGKEVEYVLHFHTAWSPPLKFFKNVSPKFPELLFIVKYVEPGLCFQGEFQIKNGNVLKDEQEKYEREDEDYNE